METHRPWPITRWSNVSISSSLPACTMARVLGPGGRLYVSLIIAPVGAIFAADGSRLPLASLSVDLVATAQALHHVWHPVDVLKECRRVCAEHGHVLVLDSVATERLEEAEMMNVLDRLRDPSHAAFRSPSTMKVIVQAAGLQIVDEHLSVGRQRLSEWMWPGEFPEERIDKVREFVRKFAKSLALAMNQIVANHQFANSELARNLSEDVDALGVIRRGEHVTVLYRQRSTKKPGEWLGRLVLGYEEGEVRIFAASIF